MPKVRIFFVRPFLRLNSLTLSPANYKRKPDVAIYYYRDTPFFTGYKMTYMQRGNYVVVVNPLSYSEVMSNDHSLAWGVYDTVTNAFFQSVRKPTFFIKFDDST
jgi:sensor c-di-GMP phosphodiesterase-like protein